jgi:hypothetical protein
MALETELSYFQSIKAELLSHHEGKHSLIIGKELIGVFDHPEEAYKEGIRIKGNVPMLIKLISRTETNESIPAMTLGLIGANP